MHHIEAKGPRPERTDELTIRIRQNVYAGDVKGTPSVSLEVNGKRVEGLITELQVAAKAVAIEPEVRTVLAGEYPFLSDLPDGVRHKVIEAKELLDGLPFVKVSAPKPAL